MMHQNAHATAAAAAAVMQLLATSYPIISKKTLQCYIVLTHLPDFPAAAAQGYKISGDYSVALDNLKWVTDYFIKCVGDGTEIVVQVGNGNQDHAVWGRPEDVIGAVPAYAVTKDRPGSDAVGAMGAALAAAAVAFQGTDKAYSAKLVDAATKAYK